MRIGFATMDWATSAPDELGHPTPGGSGWYRCVQPARALTALGHTCGVGTLVARKSGPGELGVRTWDDRVYWNLDVVVLQRWMHEAIYESTRRAQAAGQVVVNDVDDWWRGLATTNAAFTETHPRHRPDVNVNHYLKAIAASDRVVVSTPFLAKHHHRSVIVRNAVDASRFAVQPVRDRRPKVLWVGAMPWRSGDVEILSGIASQLDCDWVHGGMTEPGGFAKAIGLDPGRVEERPMTDVLGYPNLFRDADVGIVPLSDRPFNEAKSAIKGLEYAACGLPFVASATGEYRHLFGLGAGAVARRPKDWLRELRRLMDPAEREYQRKRNLDVVSGQGPADQGAGWESVLFAAIAARSAGERVPSA